MCKPCYDKIRRTEVILKCRLCEKEFAKDLGEYKKQIRRRPNAEFYCGKECSQAHHATKNAGSCKRCGKPKDRLSRFCSPECKAAENEDRKEETRLRNQKACETCGKTFVPKPSTVRFCGRLCAGALHSKKMTGKGNSNYKDGKSLAKLFDLMRQPILDRDKYRCVACGDAERIRYCLLENRVQFRSSLVIHHIDEDTTNNATANLVALCHECHMTHHKSYSTPFPWLGEYAKKASESMTSKLKDVITSLETKHLCTIA